MPAPSVFSSFFDSGNLFILFLTLTFFATVEVVFFMQVVSTEAVETLKRQATTTADILAPSASTDDLKKTRDELQSSLPSLRESATLDYNVRREKLKDQAIKTFTAPIGVSLALALVYLFLAIYRKKMNWPDYAAVFLVLFSFTTEIILYFMVLRNLDYVDDASMVSRVSQELPINIIPFPPAPPPRP